MLKTSLTCLLLLLSLPALAAEKKPEEVDIILDIKTLLVQLEQDESATLQTNDVVRLKFEFSIFEKAWAAKHAECFYGGWPSTYIIEDGKRYCTNPKNGSEIYEKGNCSDQQIQCQPQLFGKNLCVGFATRSERINTFKNCESAFSKESRDYKFVEDFSAKEKEHLKVISQLSGSICEKKSAASGAVPMCQKILNRVAESRKTPQDEQVVTLEPVRPAPTAPPMTDQTTGPECDAMIDDHTQKIDELTEDIAHIMSRYGKEKGGWGREVPEKGKVVDYQEEILCLELQVFSLSNKLGLDINCLSKPKKIPPMQLSLVKDTREGTVMERATEVIQKRILALAKSIEKDRPYANVSSEAKARIEKHETELSCLKQFPNVQSCPDTWQDPVVQKSLGDYLNSSRGTPELTLYVKNEGKLLPFKTWDHLLVHPGMGPKLKQGDLMTPEGVFDVNSPTTSTNYFTSSKIDYENWKDRKEMLEDLPASMKNAADKGGAILIHGAGGSNGCLSFNDNSQSAYITALSRMKTKAHESLQISIYPTQLTDEFIESSVVFNETKVYKKFWQKLEKNYQDQEQRTDHKIKTINEIRDER